MRAWGSDNLTTHYHSHYKNPNQTYFTNQTKYDLTASIHNKRLNN
jgi:hypothetical protein